MINNNRIFKMVSISRDMSEFFPDDVKKVRLFNFTEGKVDLAVMQGKYSKTIGTLDNCWIRVYDNMNRYYDFIASDIYFDSNEKGLFILTSEDVEFISVTKISMMISSFIHDLQVKKMTNSQYIDKYAFLMLKEIRIAGKELQELHMLASEDQSSRLDIEDTYEYRRSKLIKQYLLNLIASKIVRENKESVLELMSG